MVADTFQRMNASEGLSSVASFSLGLSMSMRGSPVTDEADKPGHAHTCSGPPATLRRPIPAPRKPSFQDLFPVQPAALGAGGATTKPAAGSTLAARRRRSSIDPTKLARWFPIKASGLLGRRHSRYTGVSRMTGSTGATTGEGVRTPTPKKMDGPPQLS